MPHELRANAWKEISACGLNKSSMPNNEIADFPGVASFWEEFQVAASNHFRKSCIPCWIVNIKISVCIEDVKCRVNCKILTDNLRLTRLPRDNHTGLENHAATCAEVRAVSHSEDEKREETTNKTFKRIFHGKFLPSSNELSTRALI